MPSIKKPDLSGLKKKYEEKQAVHQEKEADKQDNFVRLEEYFTQCAALHERFGMDRPAMVFFINKDDTIQEGALTKCSNSNTSGKVKGVVGGGVGSMLGKAGGALAGGSIGGFVGGAIGSKAGKGVGGLGSPYTLKIEWKDASEEEHSKTFTDPRSVFLTRAECSAELEARAQKQKDKEEEKAKKEEEKELKKAEKELEKELKKAEKEEKKKEEEKERKQSLDVKNDISAKIFVNSLNPPAQISGIASSAGSGSRLTVEIAGSAKPVADKKEVFAKLQEFAKKNKNATVYFVHPDSSKDDGFVVQEAVLVKCEKAKMFGYGKVSYQMKVEIGKAKEKKTLSDPRAVHLTKEDAAAELEEMVKENVKAKEASSRKGFTRAFSGIDSKMNSLKGRVTSMRSGAGSNANSAQVSRSNSLKNSPDDSVAESGTVGVDTEVGEDNLQAEVKLDDLDTTADEKDENSGVVASGIAGLIGIFGGNSTPDVAEKQPGEKAEEPAEKAAAEKAAAEKAAADKAAAEKAAAEKAAADEAAAEKAVADKAAAEKAAEEKAAAEKAAADKAAADKAAAEKAAAEKVAAEKAAAEKEAAEKVAAEKAAAEKAAAEKEVPAPTSGVSSPDSLQRQNTGPRRKGKEEVKKEVAAEKEVAEEKTEKDATPDASDAEAAKHVVAQALKATSDDESESLSKIEERFDLD